MPVLQNDYQNIQVTHIGSKKWEMSAVETSVNLRCMCDVRKKSCGTLQGENI